MSARCFLSGLAAAAMFSVACLGLGFALSRALSFEWHPPGWALVAVLAVIFGLGASGRCQENREREREP